MKILIMKLKLEVRTFMDGCYSDWSEIKNFRYESKKD